ncbi:hypothetical protein IEQ34_009434 [Dendrobium chrysotoxum]|uniref:Uncharacterized protein n=1 Tax=Dendrobium chrysotoxum TaxID=161865 RepID=A0AAV7H1C1_DENCH|nr:hypothetical protein IEQ34_009434 [Dendrobium chrysotoxum]
MGKTWKEYDNRYSRGRRSHWGMDARSRKLEMQVFKGEDAQGWEHQVERYCTITGLTEGEKLMVAGLCFKRKA